MRALKYFNKKQLLSLEEALFSDNKELRYCLLDESKKVYYISDTVNIANLIGRLRLSVMKAEYPLLAHYVQQGASTSQMVDWVLAVFPTGYEISKIESSPGLEGFTRILKARRNEVNALESSMLYRITNKRYQTTAYSFSARDLDPRRAGAIFRARLRTVCKYMEDSGLSLHPRYQAYYLACAKTIIHGAPQELEIITSEMPKDLTLKQIMEIVKARNDQQFEAATPKL